MTNDFFDATPELQTIRQWAHARYAAVWAVFYGVLLRVAASTGPEVQLPGVIGGRASLNLMCAFVSPSGGGKGISDKVARLAWPAPIIERPIGSGEGIAATFVPPKKEGIEPITRAIISVPEIDTLAGIASRQGSILLAQLKSAAMGEQLGQANSSEATTRIIPPHSYRMCLSVGAQPAHTGVLLDDTTGGTPQRFLWGLTIDPEMPADVIDDPEPLNTRLPFWKPGDDGVVEIVYGPDHIKQTIIAAHIARQRGQEDALDGHGMLTRLKVAAVLAIMHHRCVVSELDWQLSAAVMAESNRTRNWVVAEAKRAARSKVRERAISRAVGEEAIDLRRLTTVRKRILSVLSDGPLAGAKLRAALGRREYRDLFDQAVMSLESEALIAVDSTGRGTQYELFSGVNTEHPVHPSYPLVRRAEQGMNTEQSANSFHATADSITELDQDIQKPSSRQPDRRPEIGLQPPLRAVADIVGEPPELAPTTAFGWIENHVSSLHDAGTDTVESSAVYKAGQDAGFKIDNLRQAAKKSELIAVEAMRGGTAVWRLGSGGGNTVVPCGRWLTAFIEAAPHHRVKAADAYAAGLAAGYGRDAVKGASLNAHIRKSGSSVATEWSLDRADDARGA